MGSVLVVPINGGRKGDRKVIYLLLVKDNASYLPTLVSSLTIC